MARPAAEQRATRDGKLFSTNNDNVFGVRTTNNNGLLIMRIRTGSGLHYIRELTTSRNHEADVMSQEFHAGIDGTCKPAATYRL